MTVQNARILHGKRNFDVSTDLPMFDGTAVLTSSYSCTGTRTAVLVQLYSRTAVHLQATAVDLYQYICKCNLLNPQLRLQI